MKNLFSLLCGVILLFTSCEDTKKTKLPKTETLELVEKDSVLEIKKTDTLLDKTEYPKITQENVVSFFTEYGKNNPETKVLFTTSFGDIEMELFTDTPLHRANFIYLINQKYFDASFFHRVSPGFIIQGGNSDRKETQVKRAEIGKEYLLPAEISTSRKHAYGTVSGAKQYRKNPDKKTVPFEFYIFFGPQRSATHLDGDYTIFGRVTKGMEVVEEISKLEIDSEEWPLQNVEIKATVLE